MARLDGTFSGLARGCTIVASSATVTEPETLCFHGSLNFSSEETWLVKDGTMYVLSPKVCLP